MGRRSAVVVMAALAMLVGCVNDDVYKPAPGQKMRISQQTFNGFKRYQALIGSTYPGVFAASSEGSTYYFWYCKDVVCLNESSFATKALRGCRGNGEKCYIFAKDNDIKVDYAIAP
jgi:hypothetical protein